jgi:hypothetical protein
MYDPFLLVGVETVWQVTINRQLTVVPSDLFIYASVDALLPVARAHDFFYPICCCASVEIDQKKKTPGSCGSTIYESLGHDTRIYSTGQSDVKITSGDCNNW